MNSDNDNKQRAIFDQKISKKLAVRVKRKTTVSPVLMDFF